MCYTHTHTHTHTHTNTGICVIIGGQVDFPSSQKKDIQNKLKILTYVVQGRDRQRALVNKVVNFRVP